MDDVMDLTVQQRKKQVQFSENLATFIDFTSIEVEKDTTKQRKRLFRRALSFGAYRKKPVVEAPTFVHVDVVEVPSPKPILKKRSHYAEDLSENIAQETDTDRSTETMDNDILSENLNMNLDYSMEIISGDPNEHVLRSDEHLLKNVNEDSSAKDEGKSVLSENRKNIWRNKPARQTVKSIGQDSKALLAKAGLVKHDRQPNKRDVRKISCDCVTQQTIEVDQDTRMVRSPTFPSSPTFFPAVRQTLADASNLISNSNELRRANNCWVLPDEVMYDNMMNDENILNLWLRESEQKGQMDYNDSAIFGSVKYLNARNIRSR